MKRRLTAASLFAAGTAIALALTGCTNNPAAEGAAAAAAGSTASPAAIKVAKDAKAAALVPAAYKSGIKVASDIPFAPYEMYDAQNQPTGFDYDLSQAIGQTLGVPVSFDKQAFDTVIPSLLSNKFDMVMSGMNDTVEREKTLDFVDYTHAGFLIAVPAGNPKGIHTITDLCGKTASVQKATQQGELLKHVDCAGHGTPINVMELPADTDAQTAVRAGKSDAYVVDAPVGEYVIKTTGDGKVFQAVRDPKNPAGYEPIYSGIAVLKKHRDLTDAVLAAFDSLVRNGTYAELLARYDLSPYAVHKAALNQAQ